MEECYDKKILLYVLVYEVLSKDDVGVGRGSVVEEIQPGAGFETGDFVKEGLGGLP